jgi:hypothetical protein
MTDNTLPAPHRDRRLDLLRPYITRSAQSLIDRGVEVRAAWLDPSGPRDATIVCRLRDQLCGLVWDEETGWRLGGFVSGRQGERTQLAEARYLGVDVLLDPTEMARRAIEDLTGPRRAFRAHSADPEGFDAMVLALAGN